MYIAKTIIEQLGGNRFAIMTGAKHFVGGDNSLSFRLPGGGGFAKGGINAVHVTLDASDTYTLVFSRVRGFKVTEIERVTDVYCDALQAVFTRATGLQTSLGSMGRRAG